VDKYITHITNLSEIKQSAAEL